MDTSLSRESIWSRAERFMKDRSMGVLEPLVGRESLDPRALEGADMRRILVIRQHDQLGDFLLSVPALRALRERFPDARIALVVRGYFAEVARMVPHVDDVIVRPEPPLLDCRSLARFTEELREGWDLAVVLNTVSHSLTSDLLARASRARIVLGSADRVFPGSTRNFFYDLEAPVRAGRRHQSERNLDIVRLAGCTTEDLREEVIVSDAERDMVRNDLEDRGAAGPGPIIGLHIGAGKPPNRWPAERFALLASILEERVQAKVLLFWGPEEGVLRDEFLGRRRRPTHLVGHPRLARLAAYFAACDAVVCNDTGVMHLAAATKVSTVALFGPTDPADWKPFGDHVVALAGSRGETAAIGVEEVAQAVLGFIAARAGR